MLKEQSYVILFLLILCGTLNPFLKKTIAKKYLQKSISYIINVYVRLLFSSMHCFYLIVTISMLISLII